MKPTSPPPRAATRPIARPTMPTRPSTTTPAPRAARPSATAPAAPAPAAPTPPPAPPTPNEVLARLIALTPAPDPDLEVDALLAVFDAMLAQRAQVLAELVPPPAGTTLPLDGAGRQLRAELARRDAAWEDLLASALRIVGGQRSSVSKLRAYGGGL